MTRARAPLTGAKAPPAPVQQPARARPPVAAPAVPGYSLASIAITAPGAPVVQMARGGAKKKSSFYDQVHQIKEQRKADDIERSSAKYDPKDHDPARRSKVSEETHDLAVRQTLAARALMQKPGDAAEAQLRMAAGHLHGLSGALTPKMRGHLGARLLGSEGLMTGQKPADLRRALKRVAAGRQATAKDRAATVAMMGDIGALYADTGATTGIEGRSAVETDKLRETLTEEIGKRGLHAPTAASIKAVQALGGSNAVGPNKKAERSRPKGRKPYRSGIHNTGREVDDMLGIPPEHRSGSSRWDVAHIVDQRTDQTAEPLVGHMSGSPAEILQVWDMLGGAKTSEQYLPKAAPSGEDTKDKRLQMAEHHRTRQARAAVTNAMLIGQGYHSAVEVAEGTGHYLGDDIRAQLANQPDDAAHLLGGGAATDQMSALMRANTGTPTPVSARGRRKKVRK